MSATSTLTADLRRLVLGLEDDLRVRVEGEPTTRERWATEYRAALERGRTSAAWQAWRDDRLTQAAVGWVLTTVFVRFCEDNALISPVWIAGPESRRQEALDAQLAFFRAHPEETDREWLLQAVGHLASLPSTRALVDEHAALRLVAPSGDAASRLLAFWRARGDDGRLVHDLTDATLDTRFLGDLYQDLSEYAQSTFALLQTPEFVQEFILDRTLEPALAERPLDGFRLIDPTCGSGHFLLGAFDRLLDRWDREAPGLEVQARVQRALDAVHGVDLNPFAVAIARFRLTIAALKASGQRTLEEAPAFRIGVVAGDSLLHGNGQYEFDLGDSGSDAGLSGFAYETEDLAALRVILQPGRYDVVVGNPPYITVSDSSLKAAYKTSYKHCVKQWTLVVPFMERFFELAVKGARPGWVGKITANNFMKRDFGVPLVERFLTSVDLRGVVDTSGMQIPGHETPTVILFGRAAAPLAGRPVRAVLRTGREARGTSVPGPGFRALTEHFDVPGYLDDYISVADLDRSELAHHPWVLTGGPARQLHEAIEGAGTAKLRDYAQRIGFQGDTHADEAFLLPTAFAQRVGLPASLAPTLVRGEQLRDWLVVSDEVAFVPYRGGRLLPQGELPSAVNKAWWGLRTSLWSRATFGGGTYREAGRHWLEWHQLPADAETSDATIGFAFKASHVHATLSHGGHLFNSTSPVIKFHQSTSAATTVGLVALLNSSASTFWLRQIAQHQGGGAAADSWSWTFEFSAAVVGSLPVPASMPARAGLLVKTAAEMAAQAPGAVTAKSLPTSATLSAARHEWQELQARLISMQEELDWEVYGLYGVTDGDLTYAGVDLPGLALGERAFEIALARRLAVGNGEATWFTRHGSTPITEMPSHWSQAYREIVQRRLDLIEGDPSIGLLEKPEHKRRWATIPWAKQLENALRSWLLDRLEAEAFWFDRQGRPRPRSVAQLADEVGRDRDLSSVLALSEARPDVPVVQSLTKLLADEAVPYLAALRYKDPGLRKREAWESTWALQRREDAREQVDTIAVPPKYASTDYRKSSYWSARGNLDVPKERFILYPDAGRDTDGTPLLGWAGWDHAQQALAIHTIVAEREGEGWADERLVPLVAGLLELQPWVEQWHSGVDSAVGYDLAAFLREELAVRTAQVSKTEDQLRAWRPPAPTRGRRPKARG